MANTSTYKYSVCLNMHISLRHYFNQISSDQYYAGGHYNGHYLEYYLNKLLDRHFILFIYSENKLYFAFENFYYNK